MTKRAVWVHKDYFDETPDRVTWIEMINHLACLGWDITLLTGFRKERAVFPLIGRIRYVPSIKIPYLNMLTSLVSGVVFPLIFSPAWVSSRLSLSSTGAPSILVNSPRRIRSRIVLSSA